LRLRRRQRKLEQANRRLQVLATQDGLTKLANRRAFDRVLHEEWARAMEHRVSLALIFLDVDHFKHFNDSYGHSDGDCCLQLVARSIARRVRGENDFAARYGGEEFAVILAETLIGDAVKVAKRILKGVRSLAIPHHGIEEREVVTISAGVCSVVPDASASPDDLVEAADRALYQAKEQGRDRVVVRNFLEALSVPGLHSESTRAA
jgi:diguanylate cyclase (GGDEF)-like protein